MYKLLIVQRKSTLSLLVMADLLEGFGPGSSSSVEVVEQKHMRCLVELQLGRKHAGKNLSN